MTPAAKVVSDDPVFRQDDRYYLSGEEAFDRAMEKSIRYIERCRELDITDGMERNIVKQLSCKESVSKCAVRNWGFRPYRLCLVCII